MKKHAWVIGSISLVALCSLFLQQSSGIDGRSLTLDELRSTCGSSAGGCVLSGALTDCNQPDDPCGHCLDSMSLETVQGSGTYNVKVYLGADRKICTTPTVANTKVCDPGTVTCWAERSCDAGAVQTDKSCNANPAGPCATPNPVNEGDTWFCRMFTLGGLTGINQTKHDDACIDP